MSHFSHAFDVAFTVIGSSEDPDVVLQTQVDAVADAMIARAEYLRANPKEMIEACDATCGDPYPCDAQGNEI